MQLALHWRQLRSTRGTVLLGEPPGEHAAPPLEKAWFVNDCPLEPDEALDAICKRHGFASRAAALRALHRARETLRAAKSAESSALDDLP